jgi:hypothetical protein
MKKDGDKKKRGPGKAAMTRMVRLLDAFGKGHTVSTPLCFSFVGQTISRQEHECIPTFVQLAYDDGWMVAGFDWAEWNEGRAIVANKALIEVADLLTIMKLITALVRSDRFCEGSLQAAHEEGTIAAILARISKILDSKKKGSNGCL